MSDSGRGIKPEMVDKVFDRFFHFDDESTRNMGSGIGLAYVKSLVILHKGKIDVDSILNKGTIFTVELPVSKVDFSSNEISIVITSYSIHYTKLYDLILKMLWASYLNRSQASTSMKRS